MGRNPLILSPLSTRRSGMSSMNGHEYNLIVGRTGGQIDDDNDAYQSCKSKGWVVGRKDGTFVVTQKGYEAVKAYQAAGNWKKIDCI